MAIKKFLDILGLAEFQKQFHTDLTTIMSAEDAKSLKAVSISADKQTLYFYKKENPTSDIEAAFSIPFPEPVDISGKINKVSGAIAGNIPALSADGGIVDSKKKPSDFATKEQGTKADTAVQKVIEGTANGTIKVDGTDVKVHNLKSAAFVDTTAFDAAGAAATVRSELQGKLDTTNSKVTSLEGRADVIESDIDAMSDPTTGVLANAKKYTDQGIAGLKIGDYTKKTYVDTELAKKANIGASYTKAETDTKVSTLQGNIDGVKSYVGTIPAGETAKDVITYLKGLIQIAENEATYDDTAIKALIAANTAALGVLNGTGTGSVKKTISDEISKVVAGAPDSLDTLKEIADWISGHGSDAAAMNSQINTNKQNITNLQTLVGTIPSGSTAATVIEYIADYVASALETSNLSQYAKAVDLEAAEGRISSNEASISNINKSLAAGGATANAIAAAKKAGTDAQSSVDALKGKIGTIPEGSATLKDYIDAQDSAIQGNINTVSNTLTQTNKDLQTLSGKVTGNTNNIAQHTKDISSLDTKVNTAQGDVDSLSGYVGNFTDDTATTVVQYIDKKTSQAVTDATYDDTAIKASVKKNTDAITAINDPTTGIKATAAQDATTKSNNALASAKTYTNTLRDGAVATNAAVGAQNAADIDALQAKVGDGFDSISIAEIQALFTKTT